MVGQSFSLTPDRVDNRIEKRCQSNRIILINDLYDSYKPVVSDFANAMLIVHGEYLKIATPIVKDIFEKARGQNCVVGDDFIRDLHLRSAWLAEQARHIQAAYERQQRATCNLARMV